MPAPIPLERARRIALGAQGLAETRPSGRIDRRHLRKAMSRLKLLQLDSVPVIARTQHLVLFSRLGPHRFDLLDEIAYRDDEWIETWAHEASLIPKETEPNLRWLKQQTRQHARSPGWVDFVESEHSYIESVYKEVVDRGPLPASDLSNPRPRTGVWWDSRPIGTVALNWLFHTGRVGIRRQQGGFTKVYEAADRIVPEVRALPTPSVEDAQRNLVAQSVDALGIGTVNDIADYFRLPVRDASERVRELVEEGDLIERSVEGWRKPAYLAKNVRTPRSIGANTLLSPFDPVVWNRERASRLFGFDYKIEIYVPRPKRRYGYYVLPWLLEDRLVGRFDLKTDRASSNLRVLGAFVEAGQDPAMLVDQAAVALSELAEHVGVNEVVVDNPGVFKTTLERALSRR